ncbi:sugar transferase [Donghicola sp.]|jgi:lipopolysaccharide/colanic/teichoic acid biosynthesis glycosyltransferase|uniref:sugar transferase n=1 Tax=Donghicola sp. TaxID=1929294 RepID=UPI0025CB7B31|nr:sugar transferase [Donghicola sp.]MCT4578516.1 sugar transferase [Donghicola sp.]
MPFSKRLFDLVFSLFLLPFLAPPILLIYLAIIVSDGFPGFYRSERMKDACTGFTLLKFRSMKVVSQDTGVSGGDKTARIFPVGKFLRKYRLDELPQIFNVIRGDISFVGPRPPLRQYVEKFPDIYTQVLRSRPGITGMATIFYHKHEESLLKSCASAEETDAIYSDRCVPRKAQLDLIYQRNRNLCMDLWLIKKTALRK